MEVRRHQPDISPDIPRELRSDLLGKFGRNRECGAGGDRQHIALPGNSKTKESAALSRETPRLKLEKSKSLYFDSQLLTSGRVAHPKIGSEGGRQRTRAKLFGWGRVGVVLMYGVSVWCSTAGEILGNY
jgi:hypothetical protein